MLEAKEREIEQLRSQAEASDRQLKIQIKVNFEKESTSHLVCFSSGEQRGEEVVGGQRGRGHRSKGGFSHPG